MACHMSPVISTSAVLYKLCEGVKKNPVEVRKDHLKGITFNKYLCWVFSQTSIITSTQVKTLSMPIVHCQPFLFGTSKPFFFVLFFSFC